MAIISIVSQYPMRLDTLKGIVTVQPDKLDELRPGPVVYVRDGEAWLLGFLRGYVNRRELRVWLAIKNKVMDIKSADCRFVLAQ